MEWLVEGRTGISGMWLCDRWRQKMVGLMRDRCDNLITSMECQSYGGVEKGRCCVHRANFLNQLLGLVSEGNAEFNKRMVDLQQDEEGGGNLVR